MDQQDQSGDSCALDIASLAHKLRGELELVTQNSRTAQLDAGWPPRRCIIVAKVHNLTRNVDEGEYDPHYVSIGPYHYPRPQSKNLHLAREDDKLRSLDYVLSAAKAVKPSMTVEVYLEEMARLERCARRCYAQTFGDMTSEMFVRMLLLDGCYILSRFGDIKAHPTNGAMKDDGCVTSVSPTAGSDMLETVSVVRDVFYLAENQIPFFVLEKIDQLTTLVGHAPAVNGISRYTLELLETQQYAVAAPAMVAPMPAVPGNLLHLLHMQLQATAISSAMGSGERDGKFVGRWRTATEYYFAGVKFKSRVISKRGNVRCILDVKLDSGSGTLEIPCLNIDSETWRLLRNLMELEQRNPKAVGSHVTAYCIFMSQIACTERDVELLSRRGVIVHGLGTDGDVAKFFANLCKGIVFDPDNPGFNYLRATCQVLEKRFRSNPRRWMAWLRRKYFSNPWLAVGLLAAAIGLVCTVLQAAYSVLSYKGHP